MRNEIVDKGLRSGLPRNRDEVSQIERSDTRARGYVSVRGRGLECRDKKPLAGLVTASRDSVAGSNGNAPCLAASDTQASNAEGSQDLRISGKKGFPGQGGRA